jgi:hypothetical protein
MSWKQRSARWRIVAAAAALAAVIAGWNAYRAPTLVLSYALDAALCGDLRGTARRPGAVTGTAPAPAATPAAPPPPAGAPPR